MKKTKHKITFYDQVDADCLALGFMGQSDTVIMRELGLSHGQISYRLHKAKVALECEHGFRTQWRLGESDISKRVKRDMLGILRAEIRRNLPRIITHPTPEVSPNPQP